MSMAQLGWTNIQVLSSDCNQVHVFHTVSNSEQLFSVNIMIFMCADREDYQLCASFCFTRTGHGHTEIPATNQDQKTGILTVVKITTIGFLPQCWAIKTLVMSHERNYLFIHFFFRGNVFELNNSGWN